RDLDLRCLANDLVDPARDAVDLVVVDGHAVEHQGAVDADHVAVPALELPGQQLQHRLPERELAGLAHGDVVGGGGPEGDDLVGQRAGDLHRRALDPVLHLPVDDLATGRARLLGDGVGDVGATAVADDGHAIVGTDVEAGAHRVAGAGDVLRQ